MSKRLVLLFLCGGRRVKLLRSFRDALEAIGGGRIVVTDTERRAAATFVADRAYTVSPCAETDRFVDEVADICIKESVSAVIPLRSIAVVAIPYMRGRVEARLISGDDYTIETCTDKLRTAEHFIACGLRTPDVVLRPTGRLLPLFCRQRRGEGSRDAFCVRTAEQLTAAMHGGNRLFTRYLSGMEFSVDCYKDFQGRVVAIVPRERQRVRAGEVERAMTRHIPGLVEETARALSKLDFIGPATVQAICVDGTFHFTEVNLRYAGGVTLSFAAGMKSHEWLVGELAGHSVERPAAILWDLGMSRYDEEYYFRE